LGYVDSSNLYAFAGGDPVNGRDPLGLAKKKRKKPGAAQLVIRSMVDTLVTKPAEMLKGENLKIVAKAVGDFLGATSRMLTGDHEEFSQKVTNSSRALGNAAAEPGVRYGQTVAALSQPGKLADDLSELPSEEITQIIAESTGPTAAIVLPLEGIGGTVGGNVTRARGFIRYRGVDELARPTGVTARIVPDMIGTGTSSNPSIRPPGFQGAAAGHARGHLLARVLGGSGAEYENLITIIQNPVNSPVMRDFELRVAYAVRRGLIIDYTANPVYNGSELMPQGITITAHGDRGFSLDVTVLNRK
jgi:hypothetical protein